MRALSGIVLWQSLQLIPVQFLAALEIVGLLGRVTIADISALQAILLAVSIAWAATHPRRAAGISHSMGARSAWPRHILAAAAVLVGSYLVFAINLFSSFPSGSDAIAYHLPVALRWLQSGSLGIPASRAWRFSLPGNAEIGMMVLLATGKDAAVVLVNWIAMATLAIATYLLAKRMSHGNGLVATTTTLLLLSIPICEFQTFSAYVDLFGSAFLAAAFALFTHRRESGEAPSSAVYEPVIFLSAAACGISLGTKPIYYLYGAAEAMFALVTLYRDLAGKQTRLARGVLLIAAGILLPSTFWFGRAAAATGNPMFPMRVSVGNHVVLEGYTASQITNPLFDENFVRSRREWFVYPWTEWKRNSGYLMIPYGEGSGVGAAFASIVVIGLAFLSYRAFIQRGPNPSDRRLILVLVVSLLAWWFVLHRVPRFGLPILVLACVLAAPFVEALMSYRERAFAILLLGSLVITGAISSFVPFHELLGRVRTGRWTRADFYAYPPLIDELPPGSCVMNYTKLEEQNFSLAGKGLGNRVVPAFEVSSPLTREFLQQHNVDFVAEIVSESKEAPAPPLPGSMSLVSTQVVKSGENSVHWRVWRVKRP